MIAACYSLHLYCDDPRHLERVPFPPVPDDEVHGETGGYCRRIARKRGWKLDLENGKAICPKCMKANKETT